MSADDRQFVRIFSSVQPHQIQIVKALLEDNQIQSFEVNHKDSSYTFMGEIELYVNESDAVLAEFLIKSAEL